MKTTYFLLLLLFTIPALASENTLFTPIIKLHDYDRDKAELGKDLFFETRISKARNSCNTCHNLRPNLTGTSEDLSRGINPPTLLNASLNYLFGSEGKIKLLEEQIKKCLTVSPRFNSSIDFIENQIRKIPRYKKEFRRIYGKSANIESVSNALTHFIRALKTPSRFDDYLLGNTDALSNREKIGFRLFIREGCAACHNGINLGGNMTYTFVRDGEVLTRKVPTIRNITRTAPYYYDGRVKDVKEAIEGLDIVFTKTRLNTSEMGMMLDFFYALEGQVPEILNER